MRTLLFLAGLFLSLADPASAQMLGPVVFDTHQSGGGGTAGPFVLKNHAKGDGGGSGTPNVDCTGANFMVVVTSRYTGSGTLGPPADTSSNTYTQVGTEQASSTNTAVSLWRSFGAATSASFHWSEGANTENFYTYFGACFSDGSTSSVDGSATSASANTPGSITPSVNNELLVTGFVTHDPDSGAPSISAGGYTVTDSTAYSTGVFEGGGLAYQIQTTATAANPTWSTSGGGTGASIQAAFK